MPKWSNRTAAIAAMSALALGSFAAAPADAKGTKIVKQGTCSKGSHWKLKVSPDNGVIETEFEVDSNRVGEKWNVVIADNGVRNFVGPRITKAPSGSFSLNRRIPNKAGVDHMVASAKSARTGETCVGKAAI